LDIPEAKWSYSWAICAVPLILLALTTDEFLAPLLHDCFRCSKAEHVYSTENGKMHSGVDFAHSVKSRIKGQKRGSPSECSTPQDYCVSYFIGLDSVSDVFHAAETNRRRAIHARGHQEQFAVFIVTVCLRKVPD
jgi:hypothetical protein